MMKIFKDPIYTSIVFGTLFILIGLVLFAKRSEMDGNRTMIETYLLTMSQPQPENLTEEQKLSKKKNHDLLYSGLAMVILAHIAFFTAFVLTIRSTWGKN